MGRDRRKLVGIPVTDFLPSRFDVEGEESSFTIEAQSYGAQGPIATTIEDGAFTCEQQSVDPTTYDLKYGWEYAIDFSGEVVDESTIRGEAVVNWPSVDGYTEYYLSEDGYRPSDCPQTVTLELRFDG